MQTNIVLSPIPLSEIEQRIEDVVERKFQTLIIAINQQKQSDISSEFLSRKQTAKLLGISLVTLNDWTKTGKVQGYRIASRIRFKKSEVEASLQKIITAKKRA